jgi:hypothetical protein
MFSRHVIESGQLASKIACDCSEFSTKYDSQVTTSGPEVMKHYCYERFIRPMAETGYESGSPRCVPERRIASARGWRSYNSGERTSQVRQHNGAAQTVEYNKACGDAPSESLSRLRTTRTSGQAESFLS